jgi:hypothetical protein
MVVWRKRVWVIGWKPTRQVPSKGRSRVADLNPVSIAGIRIKPGAPVTAKEMSLADVVIYLFRENKVVPRSPIRPCMANWAFYLGVWVW